MSTEVVSSLHLCFIIYFLLRETIYTTFDAFVMAHSSVILISFVVLNGFLAVLVTYNKRSVVNTLLRRANNIPSTNKGRREETHRVKAVLRDNNYPLSSIHNCERALTTQPAESNFNGFVVLPYVQGISEKIGRILNQQKVKVAYKPQQTINSLFPRPKELDDSDRQKSGIVYKISCTQCNFVYHGQTERSLKTRIVEHQKAVANFDQNSKVAGHVHLFGHIMKFENVEVVGFESSCHERLFLEAWHSTLDPNSGNDHILLPDGLQRHRASMNYMVTRASFASRYFHLRMTTNFVVIH